MTVPDLRPAAPQENSQGDSDASAAAPNGTPPTLVTSTTPATRTTLKRPPRKSVKSQAKKSTRSSKKTGRDASPARSRQRSAFPASSFEDATEIAAVMHRLGGSRVRRLTIFEDLDRSPDSGTSRQAVTNSGRYGITTGSYASEWLELTELGAEATAPDLPLRTVKRAQFQLAIEKIAPFKALYDEFVDHKLPSHSVMRDFLRDGQWANEDLQALIDTFIVNAKYAGILRTISGSERLVNIDHALDELPTSPGALPVPAQRTVISGARAAGAIAIDWSHTCFYVAPIGEPDSLERRHSDLYLASLVEPAMGEFGFTVVRADAIATPGMITTQIIEHLAKSRIVLADLSFHNPNVFYEVALRHARRLPMVQLIRVSDKIPFDLDQFRTVVIDDSDIYSFVPQIETYRSEIASHIRQALGAGADVANPVTAFFPDFWSAD